MPRDDSADRLRERVETLRKTVRDAGGKALLVTGDRDVRYLTGFHGEASWALVLAKSDKLYVLSDFRFEEEIPQQAPHATPVIRESPRTLVDELETLVKRHRIDKLLFQAPHVSVQQRKAIAKKLGAKTLKAVDHLVAEQRMLKDESEIERLRDAIAVQEEAFRLTREFLEPGKTEAEVCGFLEMQMRMLGAERPSFDSIVAVGANASRPHYTAGLAKLKKNEILLVDWGACVHGYRSDMTRTVALGRMPKKIREIYRIVLDAHLAAIEHVAPGVALKEVDKMARDVITKAGYGERFRHSLGHGIGLDVHEQPGLRQEAEGELQPGQVVTIEPGIYLPGVGGVRIEDDVLVTGIGHEVLCTLPKDLDSAIVK